MHAIRATHRHLTMDGVRMRRLSPLGMRTGSKRRAGSRGMATRTYQGAAVKGRAGRSASSLASVPAAHFGMLMLGAGVLLLSLSCLLGL